ncbi:MAG: YceD family protein [Pseudomonadales bacterium]
MIAPAMNTRDDEALSYRDLAKQGARVERQIRVSTLQRLAQIVGQDAAVTVSLEFRFDDFSEVRITGQADTSVDLQCQRCAEKLSYPLHAEFDLCVIVGEDRARVANQARVAVAAGDLLVTSSATQLTVAEIVEDELLLKLPDALCMELPCPRAPQLDYPVSLEAGRAIAAETAKPFAELAELMDSAHEPHVPKQRQHNVSDTD